MVFTTSGQETEWVLFLQPRSPQSDDETCLRNNITCSFNSQIDRLQLRYMKVKTRRRVKNDKIAR